jgi:hypothetical protein
MKIRINGADADIKLETEKTVGEIICALDSWLAGSGHRLSGLAIDGQSAGAGDMEACFGKEIDSIQVLDLYTSSLPELFAESLLHLMQDIEAFENTAFEEKGPFLTCWKESPEAKLLAEQDSGLCEWAVKTFSGEGSAPHILRMMAEERLRELQDPAGEMERAGLVVADICKRLEELPLHMQTGKDARAAETINAFSGIAEKVFRIYNVLRMEGFPIEQVIVNDVPVSAYIGEFNTALKEMLAAYERHDTVLVGDLAEYEMAPRLLGLHTAVSDATRGDRT